MAKRKRRRKGRLTPEQKKQRKLQRDHRRDVRLTFDTAGFKRVKAASEKEITFQDSTSDFDDVFIFKNILVLAEYTVAKESEISTHLKKKVLYDKILAHPIEFIRYLDGAIRGFKNTRGSYYKESQYRIRIVYCSVNSIDDRLKREVLGPLYLDFHISQYFKAISNAIKRSARHELFHFLKLEHDEIGENLVSPGAGDHRTYDGSLLPEEHSHFNDGLKLYLST